MKPPFPLVPLGQVATRVDRSAAPGPDKIYRQVGVRLWGDGLYEREPVSGARTRYNALSRIETDDIVINKIWARNGSIGVAPSTLAGCYVSTEFPIFTAVRDRLDPRWFHWLSKTKTLWEQCADKAYGTSGKNRIRPEQFLEVRIPLPPLGEQRRIVARIEELAMKVGEARGLRQEAADAVEELMKTTMRQAFEMDSQYQEVELDSVCSAIIDNLHSDPVYSDDGIPCIRSPDVGWGTLNLKSARRTSEEEYSRRTARGEPTVDDIVLVREGGGVGKAAIVEEGQRFSLGQRVMMLQTDKNKVLPKFALYQLLSPLVYEDQILPRIKGSASPHLNISTLRSFKFCLPPLAKQERIVASLDHLQAKGHALKRLQTQTLAELDALVPSILDKAFKGEL